MDNSTNFTEYEGDKNITVEINDNRMSATVTLGLIKREKDAYTAEDIKLALDKAGVKMGLDEERIDRLVASRVYEKPVVVAIGQQKQDGDDGYYELFFDVDTNGTPKQKNDGTINYYDIKIFEMVNKDDRLALYHPPTQGVFGYDVTGRLIVPRPGKPKPPLRGKGFVVSESGDEYFAAIDGKVEYRNTDLNVYNILQINGNVDVSVGNIDFNGDVNITGDVISGVTIRSKGNIYIGGFVEGANIYAEKDIVFSKGVNGKGSATVFARGDIHANFIENVFVKCNGSVYADSILSSRVIARGRVEALGRKGVITGGDVTGVMGIEAKTVGYGVKAATILRIGPTKDIRTEYGNLLIKIKEVETDIEMYTKLMEQLKKVKETTPAMYDHNKYTQAMQSKIIKNSEKAKYVEDSGQLYDLLGMSADSSVWIHKTLNVGARIIYDTYMYEPASALMSLVVHKRGKELVATDLEDFQNNLLN